MAGRSLRLVLEKRLAPIPEPSAACLFLHAKKLAHAVSYLQQLDALGISFR
jgi:hypothetical protein